VARLVEFDQKHTHRLVPTKYADAGVLESLLLTAEVISDLSELDAATNEKEAC